MRGRAYRAVSLDAPPEPAADGHAARSERFGYEEPRFARVEQGADLWSLVGALGTHERAVLRLRFELDMTQPEIATGARRLAGACVADAAPRARASAHPRGRRRGLTRAARG